MKIGVTFLNNKRRYWVTLLLVCLLGGMLGYKYLEKTFIKETRTLSSPDAQLLQKYAAALETVGNFLRDIHNQQNEKNCEQKALVFIQEGNDTLDQGMSQLVCSKELHRQIDGVENGLVIVKSKFESIVSPAEHEDVFFYLRLKSGRWQIQRITSQYPQSYKH